LRFNTQQLGNDMKALVYHGRRDLRMVEQPVPVPKSGEVLLKVTHTGLCQTQIDEFMEGPFLINAAEHPLTGKKIPMIPGHEFGGVVEKCGPDVDSKWIGKQVAVLPAQVCGVCPSCRVGKINLCEKLAYQGLVGVEGGLAEYTLTPAANIVECRHAHTLTYVEPILCGIHIGKKISRFSSSKKVLVLGAGGLGVATAAVLSRHYKMDVQIRDVLPARQKRCADAGLKVASEQDLANKYEVVVDLAGSNHSNLETPFLESFRYIKPSGLCVLVGTYFHPVPFVPVDITIDIQLPSYSDLQGVGGWTYLNGGSKGIIVYRKGIDEFVAFDRHSPADVNGSCPLPLYPDEQN
ncbi:hypothetical protein EBR21_18000, partial [bacterium]|nr:hypothetical protein [bacterium]